MSFFQTHPSSPIRPTINFPATFEQNSHSIETIIALTSCIVYAFLTPILALLVYLAIYPRSFKTTSMEVAIAIIRTIVLEFPFPLMVVKTAILWLAAGTGAFFYPLTAAIVWVDLVTFAMLCYVFYITYKTKEIIDTHTEDLQSYGPKLPGLLSLQFWLRTVTAFYLPLNIDVVRDITYVNEKELDKAGSKAAQHLKLDIYKPKDTKPNDSCPVLIFIHGGIWQLSDKLIPYPQPWYMASHGWVVASINYRVPPDVQFPTHLIDCKRALRWVKANISKYGGDPEFICACGDSSGGHLASLLALTGENKPRDAQSEFGVKRGTNEKTTSNSTIGYNAESLRKIYQPGFSTIPLPIRACVVINGIYGISEKHGISKLETVFPGWFSNHVCNDVKGKEDSSLDTFKDFSTEEWLLRRKEEDIVPYLVFHGALDSIIEVEQPRSFVNSFKRRAPRQKIVYIEFPNSDHFYYLTASLRTQYQMITMLRFLNRLYSEYKEKEND
ncbi:8568_t:CDS:2 [Paraglomus occultum]|uniref:8568_t:CDS:1 n=1 Tax=Paraglomus occultum TaxID=144539 RepID=A0A9N8W6U7_9GLOM|nr:8568_t:CDS:2 [Paraglomus occultum]